jgi:hypothetical protein
MELVLLAGLVDGLEHAQHPDLQWSNVVCCHDEWFLSEWGEWAKWGEWAE